MSNFEKWLSESKARHGEKYDYSEVVYINARTKVKISCPVHGWFEQAPYVHKSSAGCGACGAQAALDLFRSNINKKKEELKGIGSKLCSKCKVVKPESEFFKDKSSLTGLTYQCKKCSTNKRKKLAILARPLKMYVTHKLCPNCKVCRPVSEFYKGSSRGLATWCKTCEKTYKASKAQYGMYASKLIIEDDPENLDGFLLVACKKCGNKFVPTHAQVQNRIQGLKSVTKSDGNFYCSERCKMACDVFRAISRRKSERSEDRKGKSCQTIVKRTLQQLQCDDSGVKYCEQCGDILGADLHHTYTVKAGVDINNPAGMILLCPGCHLKTHASCK